MKAVPLPYKQILFVCTNSREPGARISCAGEGQCGQIILDQLKKHVKENNLEEKVRVSKSGCQEKCELGPNIAVMPQNIMLQGVTAADIPTIIQRFLNV